MSDELDPMEKKYLDLDDERKAGYNCLTGGVHHGRPETIWNLSLMLVTRYFPADALKELVLSRIYNDAMQIHEQHGGVFTQDWVDRTFLLARDNYDTVLAQKQKEIGEYYLTPNFRGDIRDAAERVKKDKLNPGYEPMHPHDSINLLCRILGVGAEMKARSDLSK